MTAVLEIFAYYVKNSACAFDYEPPTLDKQREKFAKITTKYPFLLACDGDKILGFAYASSFRNRPAYDFCCETTIYLSPENRRIGIGTLLYKKLEDTLRGMNILDMYACIAVCNEEDEHLTNASRDFHSRLGFEAVGTFPKCGYKFGKWYDMIWMKKTIGKHTAVPMAVEWA